VSKPESTTILDNYTVIAPLSWLSTKRAAEDTNEEFPALIRSAVKARGVAARVGVTSTTAAKLLGSMKLNLTDTVVFAGRDSKRATL
jgi:hypothetical protein